MQISSTPLQAINQKELELRQRVHQARKRADAGVGAAKEEAAEAVARADREGRVEAEACYQLGIEAARLSADALTQQAQRTAEALGKAADRLDDAARQIVDWVTAAAAPDPPGPAPIRQRPGGEALAPPVAPTPAPGLDDSSDAAPQAARRGG